MKRFDKTKSQISLKTIGGVGAELAHLCKDGWSYKTVAQGDYVITGEASEGWEERAWDAIRFLSYTPFVAVSFPTQSDDHHVVEMVTESKGGLAFSVRSELTRSKHD